MDPSVNRSVATTRWWWIEFPTKWEFLVKKLLLKTFNNIWYLKYCWICSEMMLMFWVSFRISSKIYETTSHLCSCVWEWGEDLRSIRAWMNFVWRKENLIVREKTTKKYKEKRMRNKIKTVGSGASVYKIIFQINKIES